MGGEHSLHTHITDTLRTGTAACSHV